MRKFLQVVGIAALAILVAAPAFAIDFKMSGQYRVRWYSVDGFGAETALVSTSPFAKTGAAPAQNPTPNNRSQTDYRFRPYFIISDDNGNVMSAMRFEAGDVTFGDNTASPGSGSGGNTATDGINLETKWAYIDIQLPFGIPARMRAGTQGFYLPKGIILDDDAAGLRLYGKTGMVGYEGFWYKVKNQTQGGTTAVAGAVTAVGPSNDDIDLWAAKVDLALSPAFNPYVYGVYTHGSVVEGNSSATTINTASADGWWLGVGMTGKLGIAAYDFDFLYGSTEPHLLAGAGAQTTRRGFTIDGGVEIPVGPTAIGLRGMYATGDDPSTVNTNEDFPVLPYTNNNGNPGSYTPKGAEIFWNSNGSTYWRGGFFTSPANVWGIGGYVQYYPVKALRTRLTYYYIGAPKSQTNFFTGKSNIGSEINLLAEYTVWTGVRLYALAGAIVTPGSGRQPVTGVDTKLKDLQLFAVGIYHDF